MRADLGHRDAFSLVELMFVLAIMGVIGGLAAPRYTLAVDRYRADAAARRLVADIRWIHSRAIATGAAKTIAFGNGTSSYSVAGENSLDHPASGFSVDLSTGPYAATVVSTSVSGGGITFNGFGICTAGGSVVLRSGSCTKTVQVDSITGAASIK
jgi:prepilin-type N-terminal cleavage/methylation domain-containing protein